MSLFLSFLLAVPAGTFIGISVIFIGQKVLDKRNQQWYNNRESQEKGELWQTEQ